jgi:diguanylate cyclase (GGDEF)-like protein/PAS domain S-box-containing protein
MDEADRKALGARQKRSVQTLGSAVAVVLVALIYLAGWLDFAEVRLNEFRYRAFQRQPTADVVIVAIDPISLQELGTWPWPRTYHADVIRRLVGAGARQIGVDIDFSSASVPENDLDLQRALIEADNQVVLPVFRQISRTAQGAMLVVAAPLPLLQPHARLASVNITPDWDGIVRSIEAKERIADVDFPTLAALLVGPPYAPSARYGIDFSIDVRLLPILSFADVLTGRFDPDMVAGKTVLIGATAIELGDQLPVPLHKSLSGVLVHGLAYATLIGDRAVNQPPAGWVILLCAMFALILHNGLRFCSWQRDALVVVAFSLGILAGSVALFIAFSLLIDVTPFLLVGALIFCVKLVSRIDEQTILLFLEGLHLMRVDTLLQRIVDDSIDGILIIGADGFIQRFNKAAAQMFGFGADVLAGSHVSALFAYTGVVGPQTTGAVLMNQGAHEFAYQRRDGARLSAESSVSEMLIGKETVMLAIIRDISERKQHEAFLDYVAHHDLLTELPNLLQLKEHIDRLLFVDGQDPARLWILVLGLDGFKEINVTLGHAFGEEILREAAARVRQSLCSQQLVGRLAGEEFCIVIPRMRDTAAPEEIARHLIELLETPVVLGDFAIEIAAAVGIAASPDHGNDAVTLLRCADIALHNARKNGLRVATYDVADDRTSRRQLAITSDLRHAIAGQELDLAFQPQIDLVTKRVCGAEALVRWRHPEYGFIPPDEFVSRAEITGLIGPLTQWVVGEGVKRLSELYRRGLPLCLSINLSVKNLYDIDMPDTLLSITRDANMDPSSIVLEITENAMMHDPSSAIETLGRLRDLGFRLSIDDFGAGYSSLAYLKRLPVKELKIDRTFVMNMHESPTDQAIVQSTIALAHVLDLQVVAEGVELPCHAEMLSEFGCNVGQGYLFSRPLLWPDFLTWLSEKAALTGQEVEAKP